MTAVAAWATLVVLAAGMVAVVQELRRARRDRAVLQLVEVFTPSVARVEADPRELVAWEQEARRVRALFPDACAALDAAGGGWFPYSAALVEHVLGRWSAQWLAWEREHDLTFKRRAADVEQQLEGASPDRVPLLRARLNEIEQEKLQSYQERYEEYVRIARAIGKIEESRAARVGETAAAAPDR